MDSVMNVLTTLPAHRSLSKEVFGASVSMASPATASEWAPVAGKVSSHYIYNHIFICVLVSLFYYYMVWFLLVEKLWGLTENLTPGCGFMCWTTMWQDPNFDPFEPNTHLL